MAADWPTNRLRVRVLVVAGFLGAVTDAVLNPWARTNRLPWRWQYFSFSEAVVLFLLVNSAGAS